MRRLGFRRLATPPTGAREEVRPTRSRPPFFTALGLAAVVVLVSPGSDAYEAARPPATGPRAHTRPAKAQRPQLPQQDYGIGITYYSVRGNLQSRLTLNNKGPNVLTPTVILYGRDGRRFSSGELSIPGRTFIDVDLRELVAAAGEGFEDGSLRVSYVGRLLELGGLLTMTNPENGTEWHEQLMYPSGERSNRLDGVWWLPNEATDARLIVTNTTGGEVDVTVGIHGTTPAQVQTLRLGPWQLQVLNFGKPEEPGGGPRAGRLGGITIEHTGAPGAVQARGLVANSQAGYSAVVPFFDPAGAKTSIYHAGGVRVLPIGGRAMEPVIVARNVGARPTTVSGRLRSPERMARSRL